jgi:hypothetical protein
VQSGDPALDEDKTQLLEEHGLPHDVQHCVCGRSINLAVMHWLAQVALACLSVSVGVVFVALAHSPNCDSIMSDVECAKEVSSFSRYITILHPALLMIG